mmetsp:Transcript_43697/g.64129  ORF Transcript_43697/g.64129 Transcript_43697/m.64129 type:complete len:87 (+) Transcript_43697:174-434(+)
MDINYPEIEITVVKSQNIKILRHVNLTLICVNLACKYLYLNEKAPESVNISVANRGNHQSSQTAIDDREKYKLHVTSKKMTSYKIK